VREKRAENNGRVSQAKRILEVCDALDLPRPDPAGPDTSENAYLLERAVPLHQPGGKKAKQPWPKTLPEPVRAVEAVVKSEGLHKAEEIAKRLLRARGASVQEILDTLATLGRI
jgi:hypothetical protein